MRREGHGMKVKRERRGGLERARMIAGERRAPAAKRWEVVSAKRPSTSGQAL